MTAPRERLPGRRAGRSRRTVQLIVLLGLAVSFVVGIAVGEALHDNPRPGGSQTIVRTLDPLPVAPAGGQTVTVTVQKP